MGFRRVEFITRSFGRALAAFALLQLVPPQVQGGAPVVEGEDFSLELGLRIQPRMELTRVPASGGGTEEQRDFFIRRVRIKGGGKILDAKYKFEWKIDSTDRINGNPEAQVENAYIQFPLGAGMELRGGLYDQPFSRDLLTSDSNHLAVDRGAVSNVLSVLGLVDNAVGFHLLGGVHGRRAEYAVGLFDNRTIPGDFQKAPMVVGRLDLNFGSTANVFQDTHFGDDSWYSVGLNGSYQGALEDSAGANNGSNSALGADGMIDVPVGPGRLFVRAEVNAVREKEPGGGQAVDTTVWMAGLGFLALDQRLQPFVRFDQVHLDDTAGGGTTGITFVGANFYRKGHSLKIQGDIRFQSGTGESVDGGRLQAQVDF